MFLDPYMTLMTLDMFFNFFPGASTNVLKSIFSSNFASDEDEMAVIRHLIFCAAVYKFLISLKRWWNIRESLLV